MGPSPEKASFLSKRITFLREVPLFAELKDEDLSKLAHHFYLRKFKKKEIIFHQGDDSHMLYVVVKGRVRIFVTSPAGEETSIRLFSIYDMIGEFAAIDGQFRSTSAQAIVETTLLEIERIRFLETVRKVPDLSMTMIRFLVGKLRWTTNFAESIAQYDTAGRLLHILLHYNEAWGREIEAGKHYELDLDMSQADLATMVGARREWVNRILQDWRKKGLIESRHGKISFLDLPAVKKERDRKIESYTDEEDW